MRRSPGRRVPCRMNPGLPQHRTPNETRLPFVILHTVPQTHQYAIETEGLTKVFRSRFSGRELRAVDDISLRVPVGSTYGLLGPNGAGKTTFVKMLLSCTHPTAGRAMVFGRERAQRRSPPPHRLSAREPPLPHLHDRARHARFLRRALRHGRRRPAQTHSRAARTWSASMSAPTTCVSASIPKACCSASASPRR